jgi:hypothetical protein
VHTLPIPKVSAFRLKLKADSLTMPQMSEDYVQLQLFDGDPSHPPVDHRFFATEATVRLPPSNYLI